MQDLITSRSNLVVRQVAQLLKEKKYRKEYCQFVLEGARLCEDAQTSGLPLELLLYTPTAERKYPHALKAAFAVAKRRAMVSEELAAWLADTGHTQGIFAVCGNPPQPALTGLLQPHGHYICLEHVQDPGNLGTILRTAYALGISAVFLSENCAELYSPKVLRSAMGAVIKQPIYVADDFIALLEQIHEQKIPLYATTLDASATIIAGDLLSCGCAVLFGNEGAGLTPEAMAYADRSMVIPMAKDAESLNVGVAAAICIWEMCKGNF